jgi:hypothetical protein
LPFNSRKKKFVAHLKNVNIWIFYFLGPFGKLREVTISFIMSVCVCLSVRPSVLCLSVCLSVRPSICMGQLAPTVRIFIKFDEMFRKSVEKVQVSLKSDKNNGYFTWRRK